MLCCVASGRLHQAEDPEPWRAHGPAGGQPGRALQAIHGATQLTAECLRDRSWRDGMRSKVVLCFSWAAPSGRRSWARASPWTCWWAAWAGSPSSSQIGTTPHRTFARSLLTRSTRCSTIPSRLGHERVARGRVEVGLLDTDPDPQIRVMFCDFFLAFYLWKMM